ncbi:MAG: hypothetical protein OXN83_04440 [Oligoflexia bacterium]|nr:hypothetical protein [Oligoflexia bacterium]
MAFHYLYFLKIVNREMKARGGVLLIVYSFIGFFIFVLFYILDKKALKKGWQARKIQLKVSNSC